MPEHLYTHETLHLVYTVQAAPPPADAAKAIVHKQSPDGPTGPVVEEVVLQTSGTDVAFDYALSGKVEATDSPLAIEFVFEKEGQDTRRSQRGCFLAAPGVWSITAPADAKCDVATEVKVATWAAAVHPIDDQGLEEEGDASRIPADAKSAVKWHVKGAAISATGETLNHTFPAADVGTEVEVEAFLGDEPTGQAKATVKLPKLTIVREDDTAAPDTLIIGRPIGLKVKIEPSVAGTVTWEVEGPKATATARADAKLADANGVTVGEGVKIKAKLASTATSTEYVAEHVVTVRQAVPVLVIDKLDKWFLPGSETCHVEYTLQDGDPGHKLKLDVFGSNYCSASVATNGDVTFTAVTPVAPLFTNDQPAPEAQAGPPPQAADGGAAAAPAPAAPVQRVAYDWDGVVDPAAGILKKRGEVKRHANVAFSPYTFHVRYFKAEADKDARIDLKDFWPRWTVSGGAETLSQPSLLIKWKVSGATKLKKGKLQIVDKTDAVKFSKDLVAADLGAGDHQFQWDGKLTSGVELAKDDMPFRVELHGHTDENETTDPLAVAAAQTEVRLFAHPDTGTNPDDPTLDTNSLELSLAPFAQAVPDPVAAENRWYQYQLAMGGFNPGPVDNDIGPMTKIALKEFQRSTPKESTDTPATVAGINAAPAPAANTVRVMSDAGVLTAGTPLSVVQNDRVKFDGTKWTRVGGKFLRIKADGNKSADTKALLTTLAAEKRPRFGDPDTIPPVDLSVDDAKARLRDKDKTLVAWVDDRQYYTQDDAYVATDPFFLDDYRGTFDVGDGRVAKDQTSVARPWIPLEVKLPLRPKDASSEGLAATAHVETDEARKLVGPLRVDWTFSELPEDLTVIDQTHADYDVTMRSAKWVDEVTKAEKSTLAGKDYTNCPDRNGANTKDVGGIRPRAAAGMASYYKAPWGLAGRLDPWIGYDDTAKKVVFSLVHDDVGQPDATKVIADAVGKAGLYFNPSRIAGDGYRIAPKVSFETHAKWSFPNREVLQRRYDVAPAAHSAGIRLWRRASIRGYIGWCPPGAKTWPGRMAASTPYYQAAFLSLVHEADGAPREFSLATYLAASGYTATIQATVTDPFWTPKPIVFDPLHTWPWGNEKRLGFPQSAPGSTLETFRNDVFEPQHTPTWRSYRGPLLLQLLRRVEENEGRLKGHFIVEFKSSDTVRIQEYDCSGCATTRVEITNNCLPADLLTGTACPTGCGGTFAPGRNMSWDKLPVAAVGVGLGSTWVFLANATTGPRVWAHELGHHRHLEHAQAWPTNAGTAPGAKQPQHDEQNNPALPANTPPPPAGGTPIAAKDRTWARDCIMSYNHGKQYFCGKCLLKNRGWAVEHLVNPAGNVTD